jgi:hypothetical protein
VAEVAEGIAVPRGPVVELNAFQILMRRWSKLHPYNAGQVVRVSGAADRERWKHAAEAVIGELGLGKPRFTNGDEAVQFTPAAEVPIEQAENGGRDLETFFNEELNRPFAAGDLPIRFCILPAPGEGEGEEAHYLAAVYDHWIADSRAMRELMHRIFERYQVPEGRTHLPPLTLEVPPFKVLFGRHVGPLRRWTAMRESLKNIWRHRHGYRLNLVDPVDFASRFVYRELSEGLIDRLYRFAKSRGASVNDLFLAVIAQSTGAFTAGDRLGKAKKPLHFARRQVGVGTIVDIRDAASEPLDRVFNLYLSSYAVLLDDPEKRSADDLTREIAAETGRIKKTYETVRRYWALVMARFWYDMYESSRFRATLLHKTVPLVAGISNVNMTGSWADARADHGKAAAGGPRVLDYLRISPAGPLIPLVFTLTTIRGRLSLCVTYRTTTFKEEKLKGIVDDFVRRLEEVGAE